MLIILILGAATVQHVGSQVYSGGDFKQVSDYSVVEDDKIAYKSKSVVS